jgi:hypothetical protein
MRNRVMPDRPEQVNLKWHSRLGHLLLLCALLLCGQAAAQSTEGTRTLQQLTDERLMLTAELDQFRDTLAALHTDGTPPEQSSNPAVRSLAVQAVTLKERLIAVTEKEVTLLQQQIIAAKTKTRDEQAANDPEDNIKLTSDEPPPGSAIESKPLRLQNVDYTRLQEAEYVERLHKLLENYYVELQESARILPTAEEIAQRETAQRDAETLNKIPFSVDKVRLSGSEGSAALAHISQRLMDPRLPESRRDIAPICIIKTRLLDTLIGVENRSLTPVGKNHYILKVRLQPGDTTISILSDQWEVRLPEHADARDFLITLYRPVGGTPELHVFAVDDLLAAHKPHIPAWLPAELDIKTKAG